VQVIVCVIDTICETNHGLILLNDHLGSNCEILDVHLTKHDLGLSCLSIN